MPNREFTDDLIKLLPPSSTALERNIVSVVPFDAILDPGVKLLKRAKGDWIGWHVLTDVRGMPIFDSNGKEQIVFDGAFYIVDGDGNLLVDGNGDYVVTGDFNNRFTTVNDSYLHWLAIEYGVNELSEILPNISDRINGGVKLHGIQGTVAAILLILRWLNFPDATVIEEHEPTIHFPEYQLDLGRYPSVEEVRVLVRSMRFGEPVRSRLRRILYNWNVDRFRLDRSMWGDLLSDYSGIRIDALLNDGHGTTQMKASFIRPMTFPVEELVVSWDSSHDSEHDSDS